MDKKSTRNAITIILLAFILLVASIIIWKPVAEKQAIANYLESMQPVMLAHIQWIENNERLMDSYPALSHSERAEGLKDLRHGMEDILIDIQESNPPDELSDIKKKWNKECWQFSSAISTIIIAMNNGKPEQIPEASEILMSEANRLRQEWTEELSVLLDSYGIELDDSIYHGYYD